MLRGVFRRQELKFGRKNPPVYLYESAGPFPKIPISSPYLDFFWKNDLQALRNMLRNFFMAIFVFLTSGNRHIRKFRVQNCNFSKNLRVDPQQYIERFFIAIFVFHMPENPFIPNFKVKEGI